MKKIIIISIALLALTGCGEVQKPEEVKQSSNNGYEVQKLFTVDGITVYKFYDRDNCVYFTDRRSEVQYSHSVRHGKVTKTVRVQTICNDEQASENQ